MTFRVCIALSTLALVANGRISSAMLNGSWKRDVISATSSASRARPLRVLLRKNPTTDRPAPLSRAAAMSRRGRSASLSR